VNGQYKPSWVCRHQLSDEYGRYHSWSRAKQRAPGRVRDVSPFETPADYFLEIEAHFAARRGTAFVFSARDWALMKSWRDEGIPLPVVIEAIDHCFNKRSESGRKGAISSLRYCRHAVKELWDDRKDLSVGSAADLPESSPSARLEELAAALEESAGAAEGGVAAAITTAADGVRRAAEERSVPAIEERLMAIEDELLASLSELIGEEQRNSLQAEVDRLLAGYAGLDPKTRAKTRDANFRRLLRRRLALPRLSLFS
jgi:hypothetical protein